MTKYVNIVNHTSHPHVMADGTVYNVGLSVTPMGPQYSVVCFSPSSVTVGKTFLYNNIKRKLNKRKI